MQTINTRYNRSMRLLSDMKSGMCLSKGDITYIENTLTQFKDSVNNIDEILKSVLGPTYGGPSLSYQDNKLVLYSWGDAPVSERIIHSGKDLISLINKVSKNVT